MQEWISKNGFSDNKAFLDYAYALSTHYGEAIGALSCQMYEATALAQGIVVDAAEAAVTPTYGEVAKAVQGAKKQSEKKVSDTVGRLVKQVGADTTLKNALRDGAEFAWVPMGDTCAFCLTLASRGWQRASKKSIKGGHAEHIHANCDCQYAIRFDSRSSVQGYDPDKYLEMYNSFDGTPKEKINALRRQIYASKKRKHDIIKMNLQYFAEKDIKNQESGSLSRAIRKFHARIEEHEGKINNPEQYYPDWNSYDPRYQEGLKRHWQKEIRNFENSINDRINELRRRGDYDETDK